jgi:hypothetical protein
MKNLVGYTPLSNPDWITLKFEDGTESTPVQDPDGTYRAEVDQIAKKIMGVPPDPMANATASLGSDLAGGAGAAVSKTDAVSGLGDFKITEPVTAKPAQQGGDAGAIRGALKSAMRAPAEGGMPAGGAPIAPPAAPAAQPAQPPPTAGPGPLVTTGSTSSWQRTDNTQRSSSGIAEADRPKVEQTQEAAIGKAEQANEADFAARANQVWSEWGRLTENAKKQVAERSVLQEQERAFNGKLESAYKKYDEDAKRPIDPAQAFAGEKKWYAFMAGFGDVLRNVGAALAGKGPVVDPGKVLDDLVERSVQLQMAQKEQDLKAGRISIDRFNADRETVRHRLGVVVSQLAQTELDKAQTEQTYKGLGAIKAKGDAIVADARAKGAQALARQETIAESHGSTTGGTTERKTKADGGAASLDQISQLLDIEKKKLELRNAQLDSATVDDVSSAIGKNISPERAKQLRDSVKENAVPLAKLGSFMAGMKEQLRINGATVDWETGKVVWPKDLSGVSAVKPSDVLPGPVGKAVREGLNTNEEQLNRQKAFNRELLTTDTTGAVATPEQGAVFDVVLGGEARNEEAYKGAVESAVKHLVARRHGFLTAMGEDGSALYKATESKLKNAEGAKLKELGVLPEGKR